MRAVALAEAPGMPISSHLYPELSAQMLSVTPTRHWLENVDWANSILKQPLEIKKGQASPSKRPGSGLDWNEKAVAKFQL